MLKQRSPVHLGFLSTSHLIHIIYLNVSLQCSDLAQGFSTGFIIWGAMVQTSLKFLLRKSKFNYIEIKLWAGLNQNTPDYKPNTKPLSQI